MSTLWLGRYWKGKAIISDAHGNQHREKEGEKIPDSPPDPRARRSFFILGITITVRAWREASYGTWHERRRVSVLLLSARQYGKFR